MDVSENVNLYPTGYEMNNMTPQEENGLPKVVRDLFKRRYPPQGSDDWLKDKMLLHYISGTTSDVILTSPLRQLAIHMGWVKPFVGNVHTKRGNDNEPVAMKLFQEKMKMRAFVFGLIEHPEIKNIGVSPDGITEHGDLVEIKCPGVINKTIKKGYMTQMQMLMEVIDLPRAYFVQYQVSTGELDVRIVNRIPGWFNKHKPKFLEYIALLEKEREMDPEWFDRYVAWTKYAKENDYKSNKPLPDIVMRFLEKQVVSSNRLVMEPEGEDLYVDPALLEGVPVLRSKTEEDDDDNESSSHSKRAKPEDTLGAMNDMEIDPDILNAIS